VDALKVIWLARPSSLVVYLAVVIFGVVLFRRTAARRLRARRPVWHRVLLAAYLALVFTPSIVTDFFLVGFPGPAFLGFLFLIPGTLANISDPRFVSFVVQATAIYHLFPLLGGFAVAYLLLWACSRLRPTPATPTV
jgi:hypothetical protein